LLFVRIVGFGFIFLVGHVQWAWCLLGERCESVYSIEGANISSVVGAFTAANQDDDLASFTVGAIAIQLNATVISGPVS